LPKKGEGLSLFLVRKRALAEKKEGEMPRKAAQPQATYPDRWSVSDFLGSAASNIPG